ncbi:uncharacterized protein LOC134246910 [Saccostrea cucullata]|uniref:uncharacterized protein LOC134246910 n=1 Tax=Saccostrea cuccullata TaxID=36930 RepID=UPI002ED1AC2B
MKELLGEEENEEALARENIMVMFLTVILLLSNFLSIFISSRCKKRYFLLWTDKALLLVLWTCGDVERNPGPNETTTANGRSQILRKFRRFSQTMLLELIYKVYGEEMSSKPHSKSPPGWDEYKPEIKFGNISNLKSGEDKVFNKMLYVLKNQKPVPLSSDWEVLLSHYNNLNEKLEVEESKKALNCWMLEKNLAPLLQSYSEDVDVPSGNILSICKCILKKVQVDVSVTKETDDKDRKTKENQTNRPEQLIAEAKRENSSSKLFKVQTDVLETKRDDGKHWKTHESKTNGGGLSSSSDHYTEIQSVEVPDHSQRKRKRMETINIHDPYEERMEHSIDYKRTYPVKNHTAIVIQKPRDTSKKNNTLLVTSFGVDKGKRTNNQSLSIDIDNADRNMAQSNSGFDDSDCDQISLTIDEFEEHQEIFPSNFSSGEQRHDEGTCQELIPDFDMVPYSEILNTICDDIEEMQNDNLIDTPLYEEEILRMSLKRYLKELGNNKPSSTMIQLCKEILNK